VSDIFQDAQAELDEQARWGENRAHRAIRKALVVLRLVAGRVKQLEDRVSALEQRIPPS
jgi:hypothetical protein